MLSGYLDGYGPRVSPVGIDVAKARDVLTNLGPTLRTERERRALTRAVVAKQLRTTSTTLARWETGDMGTATYTQIMAALAWLTTT